MNVRSTLEVVLIVLGIILAGVGIYAVVTFVAALREIRTTLADFHNRSIPLLEKVDVTVDAINAELLRVDGIVTDFEEVSGAVSSATEIIRTPVDALAGLGGRIARSLSRARRS